MGLASIAAARASEVRTQSEMDLYKVENKKRINVESTLSQARAKEVDGRANEADSNKNKTVAAFFDKKISDIAAEIATIGLVSAVLSTVSSLASVASSSVSGGKVDWVGGATALIQGGFSIAGAILAMNVAQDEAAMLGEKFDKLSAATEEDQKGMQALDVAFG